MGITEVTTPAFDVQSTDFIFEYVTLNPLDIQMVDQVPETNTDIIDGTFVFYGLGGILIFFVIYIIFYRYILYCKDLGQWEEMQLRELYQRASRPSYRPPVNQSRIFVEDFNPTGRTSVPMSALAEEGSCSIRTPEYLNAKGETQETRVKELATDPSSDPQQILKHPADGDQCPHTTVTEVSETSGAVSNSENTETIGRADSWMSEKPLGFSTPQDSNERIFFPEDFADLLVPNTSQNVECSDEQKSDAGNSTPTKGEKQFSPTPKGKSRSSPSSPDIVRRRLTTSEETPRRPFSWQ